MIGTAVFDVIVLTQRDESPSSSHIFGLQLHQFGCNGSSHHAPPGRPASPRSCWARTKASHSTTCTSWTATKSTSSARLSSRSSMGALCTRDETRQPHHARAGASRAATPPSSPTDRSADVLALFYNVIAIISRLVLARHTPWAPALMSTCSPRQKVGAFMICNHA